MAGARKKTAARKTTLRRRLESDELFKLLVSARLALEPTVWMEGKLPAARIKHLVARAGAVADAVAASVGSD